MSRISIYTGIGAVPGLYIQFHVLNSVCAAFCQKVPVVKWPLHSVYSENMGMTEALSVISNRHIYMYLSVVYTNIYIYACG